MDNSNPTNVDHDGSSPVAASPVIDSTREGSTPVMDPNRQPPMTPEAQRDFVDSLMTVEDDDDMPSLQEVSSSDSDIENIALDANLGAQDMQNRVQQNNNASSTTFSTLSPPPSSTPGSPPRPHRNNRRARVEDDDDELRDRRHPSQRVGSSNSQPSTSNAPPNPFFGPFFTSNATLGLGLGPGFFNRTSTPNHSENSSTPNMNSNDGNTIPTPVASNSSQSQNQGPPQNTNGPTDRRAPMHFVDYEFSIVMDGSRRPHPMQRAQPPLGDPTVQGQPGDNPPTATPSGPTVAGAAGPPLNPNISFNTPPLGNLATLLGMPFALPTGAFMFPQMPEEKEDPERARKLVDGLEEVPVGLVRRLERVGTGGGGMGEDETKGGDVGCAVCWDRLLYVEKEGAEEQTENQGGSEGMMVDGEACESAKEEEVEPKYPKVVSLPCAHVFHAECLIPWFSRPRHTTCPTCRFNIDPDNLTYVSPRQRRREQQRAANDDNNGVNPSEDIPEEGPADMASTILDAAETTNTAEQPPQPQQGGGPIFDPNFANFVQMLNVQGQPQQQQPAAGASDNNGAAPSGAQPQAQGPPPLMSMPLPGNFFPVGFAAGQLPMPFIQPGNAQAVPMPMPMQTPWRMMADPFHVATGGGNRTNATPSNAAGGANASGTPATTFAEPPLLNNPPQPQSQPPHHPPTIIADVVRISFDMVFDGRPRRRTNQGSPNDNPAGPQPAWGNTNPQNQEQTIDEDTNEDDDDDEPPELMSTEEAERENNEFMEFLDHMRRNRQNAASNGRNVPHPTANNNSEQLGPQTQPRHQFNGVPVYSMEDIHVAGAGRSFGEAFTQALSRLQTQMAQPGQEGQNPQPADPAAATNGDPPPAPPPAQQAQAGGQPGQGQRPWQFMALPFMDFGFPMRTPQSEGEKRPWAPPPPPGPTLRQRIERREWEAGLRCHDVSCGLGPSDEDPLGDDINETLRKGQQMSIMRREGDAVCEHKFHSTCLVSAERVALRGAEAIANETGGIEVSCPVCRGSGCVTREQWDEGVRALQ